MIENSTRAPGNPADPHATEVPAEGEGRPQGVIEQLAHAAGTGVKRVREAAQDPTKAVETAGDLLEVVKRNPGKTAAAAGLWWVGLSAAATTALVGGTAAAIGGGVRTAQHMAKGESLPDALQRTRDDAIQLTAQAKQAFGALRGLWSAEKDDQGGGDKA